MLLHPCPCNRTSASAASCTSTTTLNLTAPLLRCHVSCNRILHPCSQLHEHYYELPAPIRGYIQEVKAQLAQLTEWPEAGIDVEEKLSFFKETRHAYGRTALLLSGGGGLGSFHLVGGWLVLAEGASS